MKQANLPDIAAKMKGIDIAILSTRTTGGEIASRPMSNNGDVTYTGDSYFFTYEEARCVSDIEPTQKSGSVTAARAAFFPEAAFTWRSKAGPS